MANREGSGRPTGAVEASTSARRSLARRLSAWAATPRADRTLGLGLGLAHALVWLTQPVGTSPDSLGYLLDSHYFLRGEPAYFPPAYGLFLRSLAELAGAVSANPAAVVSLVQHALMVAAMLALLGLLRRCCRPDFAFVGTVAASATTWSLFLPQALLSENLALAPMVGALSLAVRAGDGADGRATAALSGALAALATLARVVPAVILPAVVTVQLLPVSRRGRLRAAAAAAAALLSLAVPISWFALRSGQPQITNSLGLHLYDRVVWYQGSIDPAGSATQRLRALVGSDEPLARPHWEIRPLLERVGIDYRESERLLGEVAVEGLRRAPYRFVALSLATAAREAWAESAAEIPLRRFDPAPPLTDPSAARIATLSARFAWGPVCGSEAFAERWRRCLDDWSAALWTGVRLLALAGGVLALAGRPRPLPLALVSIIAAYLLASAVAETYSARYNIPVLPFLFALATMAAERLFDTLRDLRNGLARAGQRPG